MKRSLVPAVIFLIVFLAACTKDKFGRSHSVLANRSAHRIVVVPYANGLPDSSLVRAMNPGDSAYVFESGSNERDVAPTWTEELRRFDSVRVAFIDTAAAGHDTVRIAHVRAGIVPSYPKYIPFSAARSLYNKAAWSEEIIDDSRNVLIGRFTYTFTEADFRAAR
ncbi:hypothetical protein EPD60_03210 [Flaviaesturariibacter flavus]|uniref:Uncharacterized protein n=1 Tax=Flaviaesturariibacter flavus TaxID=2502780 RepID=A0A4R1BMT4_9BACT|nr:hypothetical protein [Flaviaesturariibacter flavus]TCJ18783.1 hypothetical protein EPD60_03210 [Flaviaesturariibacter flavus]